MVGTDYQSIRKEVQRMGISDKIQKRAKELQKQLSEPNAEVPEEDALEMAWLEYIDIKALKY